MSQNNHAAKAEALVRLQAHNRLGFETADAQQIIMHLEANTEATLALAYEQRTANLIALYSMEDGWQLGLNRAANLTRATWDDVATQIAERMDLQ